MIKLDERLTSLVKYINKSDKIIDIGCDHALLDIYLVKEGIIDKAIVSDISSSALNQGINNIKKYNLDDKIDSRCGDGLNVLDQSDDIDTVIISGMGSNTIIKILNNKYLNKVKKIIIQSNNDYYLLRKEINNMGFIIENEEAIKCNDKYYLNIVFIKGNKKYSDNELKYGVNIINQEMYYNYLIDKNNKIISSIKDNKTKKKFIEEIDYLKSRMNP